MSLVYVICLGKARLLISLHLCFHFPNPNGSTRSAGLQLIKPELAEKEWREEDGEEKSGEERKTYPGSHQELGHG